ncbi:MAG TPA: hypothetical protein VHX87_04105 [Galbitalea sp.]|jgi:predicted small lipoprotein YifL|nr:hypothetical protein [Galbitalea sp.]
MRCRVISAFAVSLVLVGSLAGCQATGPGSFTRSEAQTDVAKWTTLAVRAVGSPATTSQTKLNAFEACRSDHGFFTTTLQWRTITNIDVPASRQVAVTRVIEKAFEQAGWRASTPQGFVTLTGPDNEKRRGAILIQTAGATQLAISVVSPCYV